MPVKRKDMSELRKPDGKLFKQILGKKEHFRSFLENNLPMTTLASMDLSTSEMISDTILNSSEKKLYSDILYKVALRNGKICYIYLLLKYKSNTKIPVYLHLAAYMTRIWEMYQEKNNGKKLIPIIPIILHRGGNTMLLGSNFSSQFDYPTALERYIPHFQFKLCDLSTISVKNFRHQILLD